MIKDRSAARWYGIAGTECGVSRVDARAAAITVGPGKDQGSRAGLHQDAAPADGIAKRKKIGAIHLQNGVVGDIVWSERAAGPDFERAAANRRYPAIGVLLPIRIRVPAPVSVRAPLPLILPEIAIVAPDVGVTIRLLAKITGAEMT